MGKRWDDDELYILHTYFPKGGIALCQDKGLKRDTVSIRNKVKNLGLKRESGWSDKDLEILYKYYPIGGYKLCQEKGLPFVKSTIISKARKYGLVSSNGSNIRK